MENKNIDNKNMKNRDCKQGCKRCIKKLTDDQISKITGGNANSNVPRSFHSCGDISSSNICGCSYFDQGIMKCRCERFNGCCFDGACHDCRRWD